MRKRADSAKARLRDVRNRRAARPLAERTAASDVFVLSVPLFIELFMQIMMGNINQLMLAPLGTEPAAAVGNALQILNIITIALSAMGTASTVLITRALGKSPSKGEVSEIGTVALAVNLGLAVLLTAVLFAFWPQFFTWLNIDQGIWGLSSSFLLIVGSTTILQGAFFAFTALLRSYARAADVMKAGLVMNLVNVGAGAALIGGIAFVPSLGVEGAAFANVAARVVGLVVACRLVLKHTDVRMRLAHLRPFPWQTLKSMLGVGVPSSGEQMNYDLAQIVILSFINVLGTTVVTVKVYCSMIAGIAYLYSIALSQATQIVLGYLFGAGKFDAVAKRVWAADLIAIALTTFVSTIIWLNADAVLGLFTADPMVHELGRQVLLVEIFLGIGRALNIVMVRALIAVGDTKTPVTVNVVSSWIFAVGGGYLLGIGLGWGIVGMWIAMCVDEWLRAGFLLITFAKGGWRTRANASVESGPAKASARDLLVPNIAEAPALGSNPSHTPTESSSTAFGARSFDVVSSVENLRRQPCPGNGEPSKPKEPVAAGLPAVVALAAADQGGLSDAISEALNDAIVSLW